MANEPVIPPPATVEVPRAGVQGIILRGYEDLQEARFLLLHFSTTADAAARREWLRKVVAEVRDATERPTPADTGVNIAFTFTGLAELGLKEDTMDGTSRFTREFQEGMDVQPLQGESLSHRQSILGDVGKSASSNWEWGKYNDAQPVHALLMLYAGTPELLELLFDAHFRKLNEFKITVVKRLDTTDLPERKEQFGFRDGIGQPVIVVDSNCTAEPFNQIKPGEILLGFPNAYDKWPVSPAVIGNEGVRVNFGYGGSYMVFRQLHQEVYKFWHFMHERTAQPGLSADAHDDARDKLAAKAVGRWRSGCPLAASPLADNCLQKDKNDFDYDTADSLGVSTPIGSHIRRTNPRDSLEPGPGGRGRLTQDESRRVTNLHRMVRRGRPYGPPVHESMKPAEILKNPPPGSDAERGLHFICFNASIARQFEFVQQTWLNNPKFGGLYADTDPLAGQRYPDQGVAADNFTVQGTPLGHRHRSLPEFVIVRGGAYFFMPGVEALKHLAGLPAALPPPYPEELGEADDKRTDAPPAGSGYPGRRGKLELAKEYPPVGEDGYASRLAELLQKKVENDYPTGLTRRDAHAKQHGCVRAEFTVEPNLPPELRVGVFREPRTFEAWVRFSNQDGVPRPDTQRDIRGMAIKLMGVDGEKLLETERAERTQDFVLISHPVFVSKDVEEFFHLIQATVKGALHLGWFFFNPFNSHVSSFFRLMASLQRHANPLEVRYWSTTPYLFGDRAVKCSARPQTAVASAVPDNPSPDYLKDALKQSLTSEEARFDFLIQFQTDPVRMPIEHPGVLWPETLSPFRKVATIRIPQQAFDSPEQMAFGEHLSFTPWHSLPDHRPLGGINRARKLVYRIISEFRHRRNQTPKFEPTSWNLVSSRS